MPLHDFRCRTCGREFEALVGAQYRAQCPGCGGDALDQLPSTFAVSSAERRQASAAASRRKQREVAGRDAAALQEESEKHRREEH